MAAPPDPATAPRLDPRAARGVLIVLAACALMVMYVETMVIPGLVRFQTFFGSPPVSTIAWILSAYLLVGVVATPIFGRLGDIYGKKRMLLVVLGTYAIAVVLAGFSPEFGSFLGLNRGQQLYLFIGMRGVQGVGMAMFPLAFAMIGEAFPPKEIAPAQGIISAMFAAGASLGLFGGAYLTETYGWQFTYHTVVPISIIVFVLAAVVLKESKFRVNEPVDLAGSAFLGLALGTGLFALTEGPTWGWGTWVAVHAGGVPLGVPMFAILSFVFLAAFILWEPRARAPIVVFARLKERNILVSNINGLFVGTGMFLVFVTNTYITQSPGDGLALNVFQSGLLSLPGSLSMLATGPFLGRATAKYGPRPVMTFGFVMIAIGGLLLSQFDRIWWELAILPILVFVGMVSVMIAMTNVIVLTSARKETGAQLGMNLTFRNLGSAVGPVVATSILTAVSASFLFTKVIAPGVTTTYALSLPTYSGFADVYLLAGGIGVVGAVLSLALRNFRFAADGTRSEDSARGVPSGGLVSIPGPSVDAAPVRPG